MKPFDTPRPQPEQKDLKDPISIEFAGGHRLLVHEGKFSILGKEGNPLIRNARASVGYDGKRISLEDSASVVTRTEDGKGVKIEVAGTKDRPGMTTEIQTGEDGLRIKQEIVNTTGKDIKFDRFTGLDTKEGLGGKDPRKMWASAMGWTVWEPPIEGIVDKLPQTNQIAIRPHVNDERYDIVSKTHKDGVPIPWAVSLRDVDTEQKIFMGYLPRKGRPKHIGVVEPRENGIEAWNDGEGVTIRAGEKRQSEELVVRFDKHAFVARAEFAKEYAERVGVKYTKRDKPENGFVTWYDLFNNIDPHDVPALIDATAKLRDYGVDVNYFTLDDVHNPKKGKTNFVPPGNSELVENFLSVFNINSGKEGYNFGDNVEAYAKYCEARGLRPEIWMAPFIVSSRAPAFEDMMKGVNGMSTDMLLKNRDGEIFVTHFHPEQDAEFYALDLTNEKTQDFLRKQIRFFTDRGIRGLKFDFSYPGAMQGVRTDNTKTSTEAYAIGLKIIEEETTDKGVSVLWGGEPLYETAGPWKGRLAPDSEAVFGIQWDPLPVNAHLRRGKSLRNASANSLIRAAEGYFLYGDGVDYDPTPVAVEGELPEDRVPTTKLSIAEMRTSVAVDRAMGVHGKYAIGHDPRYLIHDEALRERWLKRFKTALESDGGVSIPVYVNEQGYPVVNIRITAEGTEVIVINWDKEESDISVPKEMIDMPNQENAVGIFPDSTVHEEEDHVIFRGVPAHGAQVYTSAA